MNRWMLILAVLTCLTFDVPTEADSELSSPPSLSTMWMQHRASHVADWWELVQQLGFQQIELSHIITPAMLEGLRPGDINVSSVHLDFSFCALPLRHTSRDPLQRSR